MTLEEKYRLSCYEELTTLDHKHKVSLVRRGEDGELCVKKVLDIFHGEVYQRLKEMTIKGVPRLYEVLEEDNHLIIIEEYVTGETLEKGIEKRAFDEAKVEEIILQVCDILHELHRLNPPIIHRDLKPSNLMMDKNGCIYLVDFDAARQYQKDMSVDTELFGTKEYASPEQYGFQQTDERSDIYSLGVMLNELLTGYLPKEQRVKGRFQKVVDTCTQMDPKQRYQSVLEVKEAIKPDTTIEKKSLVPPGFRTKKVWKIVVAILGYISIIDIGFTAEVVDTNNKIVTEPVRLTLNHIFMTMFFLLFVWIPANYLNCQRKLPKVSKVKQPWKFLLCEAYAMVLGIVLVGILTLIENVLW